MNDSPKRRTTASPRCGKRTKLLWVLWIFIPWIHKHAGSRWIFSWTATSSISLVLILLHLKSEMQIFLCIRIFFFFINARITHVYKYCMRNIALSGSARSSIPLRQFLRLQLDRSIARSIWFFCDGFPLSANALYERAKKQYDPNRVISSSFARPCFANCKRKADAREQKPLSIANFSFCFGFWVARRTRILEKSIAYRVSLHLRFHRTIAELFVANLHYFYIASSSEINNVTLVDTQFNVDFFFSIFLQVFYSLPDAFSI